MSVKQLISIHCRDGKKEVEAYVYGDFGVAKLPGFKEWRIYHVYSGHAITNLNFPRLTYFDSNKSYLVKFVKLLGSHKFTDTNDYNQLKALLDDIESCLEKYHKSI